MRMTNAVIATSPKAEAARRLARLKRGIFWIGRSADCPNVATTTWSSCMPGARHFPPLLTLPPLARGVAVGRRRGGLRGGKPPGAPVFLRIWWKRRSGRSWETARRKATCWSIWSSSRWIAPCPWPCFHRMRRLSCLIPSNTLLPAPDATPSAPSRVIRAGCFQVRRLMPPRCFAGAGTISPESPGRGAGAGRGHPNERRRKRGHPPVDAGAAGEADPTARPDRLCASWQLRPHTTLHPAFQEGIRRLYLLPTRLSMTAICEHLEMHRGRDALSAGDRQAGQASLLQTGAYRRAALADGAGPGGPCAKGPPRCRVHASRRSPLCSPFRRRRC